MLGGRCASQNLPRPSVTFCCARWTRGDEDARFGWHGMMMDRRASQSAQCAAQGDSVRAVRRAHDSDLLMVDRGCRISVAPARIFARLARLAPRSTTAAATNAGDASRTGGRERGLMGARPSHRGS